MPKLKGIEIELFDAINSKDMKRIHNTISFLKKAKYSFAVKNENNETFLHAALRTNDLHIVSCILEEVKDIFPVIYAIDINGINPFHLLAANPLFIEPLKKLLAVKHPTPLYQWWNNNSFNGTPIHYAVGTKNISALKLLLNDLSMEEKGDVVNYVSVYGDTALHYACQLYKRDESTESLTIINLLIDNGASCTIQNNEGFTPNDIKPITVNTPKIQYTRTETSRQAEENRAELQQLVKDIEEKLNAFNKEPRDSKYRKAMAILAPLLTILSVFSTLVCIKKTNDRSFLRHRPMLNEDTFSIAVSGFIAVGIGICVSLYTYETRNNDKSISGSRWKDTINKANKMRAAFNGNYSELLVSLEMITLNLNKTLPYLITHFLLLNLSCCLRRLLAISCIKNQPFRLFANENLKDTNVPYGSDYSEPYLIHDVMKRY